MVSTSAHLDTPIRLTFARPEQITVTAPPHPLFGRCFALASMTGSAATGGHAFVVYRGDVLLKLPIEATSLSPAPPPVSSKLSLGAIRDPIPPVPPPPGGEPPGEVSPAIPPAPGGPPFRAGKGGPSGHRHRSRLEW